MFDPYTNMGASFTAKINVVPISSSEGIVGAVPLLFSGPSDTVRNYCYGRNRWERLCAPIVVYPAYSSMILLNYFSNCVEETCFTHFRFSIDTTFSSTAHDQYSEGPPIMSPSCTNLETES